MLNSGEDPQKRDGAFGKKSVTADFAADANLPNKDEKHKRKKDIGIVVRQADRSRNRIFGRECPLVAAKRFLLAEA
jgi:hypothetical protein